MASKNKKNITSQAKAPVIANQELTPLTMREIFARDRTYIIVLTFVAVLLYILSVNNGYNLDDFLVSKNHPLVSKGIAGIPDILTSPYYNSKDILMDYRPIAQISFAIERSAFGDAPGVSHFINVLLYAFLCVCLYLLLRFIFPGVTQGLIWLGALLFTVHPLHAEVVNNLKSRDELFSLLFGLFFLWMVVSDMRSPAWRYKVWSVVFLLLSLMSKVSILPLILFVPVYVLFHSKDKLLNIAVWLKPAFYIACWLVYFLVMTLVAFPLERTLTFTEMPIPGNADIADHLNVIFPTIFFYIKMMVAPYPLSSYYGFNTMPPEAYKTLVVLLFFSGSAWLFFRGFRQRRFYALLIAWFIAAGFLFYNIGYHYAGIVSERAAFIMSIPGSLGLAMLTGALIQRKDISIVAPAKFTQYVVYGLALVYGFISFARVSDWKDQFTLFSKDVRHYPESGQLNHLLGVQYDLKSREPIDPELAGRYIDTAFVHFNKALSVDQYRTDAIAYIGRYYIDRYNNFDTARTIMLRAWEMKKNGEIAYELARTSTYFGKWEEAVPLLEFTTKDDTTIYWAWYFLAQSYFETGRIDEAFAANEQLLKYTEMKESYHLNAAIFFGRLDRMKEAAFHMREAVVSGNRDPRLIQALRKYYNDTGDSASLTWLDSF